MATFYDEWLATGEVVQGEFQRSPMIARDREVPWVRTRQDAKVKLMVSAQQGFPTMGSNVLKGEIPVGWHTGRHSHGEESIHVLQGQGFIVINGQRFDFHTSSTIQVPYRAEHQLFNTGDEPVLYVSGMSWDLERFVRLARMEQVEDCGENDKAKLADIPQEDSQSLKDGPRAVIHLEQAPTQAPPDDARARLPANQNQHYLVHYLVQPFNGFKAGSVGVTHIFYEPSGHHGGRHKHLEAMIFILEGEGYSEVQGVQERWETGDVLHVPPAMYEHEHYNDTSFDQRMLRIEFGIRFWFTDIWPEGYTSTRIYDEFGQPIISGRIERIRERQ